ncbi:MAG: hypothetical protein ABL916_18300 [Burkholderiaceae bacterium]
MKHHEIDLPLNTLRRKLLLGLPSGWALATPLALIGCGGGGADGSTAPTGAPVSNDPPGPLSSATMSVQVELPDAIAAAAGTLRVLSATGASTVASNSADVSVLAGGPQLVSVIGADGNTVALGWAGTGQPAVSPQSTAAVLLAFGLGLPFLGAAARDALRVRLQGQPAVAAFGARIASELRADPKALTTLSPGIADAFVEAAEALLPGSATAAEGRARALGLVVEPASEQSGLQVVQGEVLNSFFVDNAYVRRAVVALNRESYVDSAGAEHVEPNAPVQVGEVMALPLPTAVDSVANVVGGWASEYYAPDDANGFWRSVTDPTTLEITPADAKRTRYNVVVLMAGALPPADAAQFARLPASQKAYVTGLDLGKNLVLQMLLQDLLAPLFFEFLSSRIGAGGKKPAGAAAEADAAVLGAFAAQMLAILQSRLPDVVQQLSDGSTDAWTAFKTILKACTFDPNTGEISPLLQEFLSQGAELCAKSLADVGLRSRMLDIATGFKLGNKNVLGFLPVLKIISVFDKVLGKAALLRIVADSLRSRRMVSWGIVATKAKVVLKPKPLVVEESTVSTPVKVEIVDNDNDVYGNEQGSFRFEWVCTGLYGDLFKRNGVDGAAQEKNRFSTSNANATTDYLTRTRDDSAGPETITVTAYFEPIGSGRPAELIGSASTTVQFKKAFSLKITPVSTDLSVDSSIGVTATLNEELPANADARFEWSLAAGGGTVALTGTDSDTRHAYVEYRSPADETTATVECVAVITLGTREVRTDPVSATIRVKKGLRTIEVEGNWVYESGVKLRETPECFFDGQGKQACALGYLDDWVVYQIPKVANALSYSIRLLAANGSERVRYGYPTGNYASSVLDDGGGALRIRYWAADGPFGSYDGVSNYPTTEANARAYLLGRVASDGPRIVATVTLKS